MADTIGTRFGDRARKWTAEEDEYLVRRLREEGATYTQVGIELGRPRCSIAGRVYRKRKMGQQCGQQNETKRVSIDDLPVKRPDAWPDNRWQALVDMVADRKTNVQISEAVGGSDDTVKRFCARVREVLGIVGPGAKANGYTPEEDEIILNLRSANVPYSHIAAKLGRTESAVSNRLKKLRKALPEDLRVKAIADPHPNAGKGHKPRAPEEVFDQWARITVRTAREEKYKSLDTPGKPHMAGLPLERLNTDMCRFACNEGNPRDGIEHLFCGELRVHGKRYCAVHLPICEVRRESA